MTSFTGSSSLSFIVARLVEVLHVIHRSHERVVSFLVKWFCVFIGWEDDDLWSGDDSNNFIESSLQVSHLRTLDGDWIRRTSNDFDPSSKWLIQKLIQNDIDRLFISSDTLNLNKQLKKQNS
jgi:hypothetical protein